MTYSWQQLITNYIASINNKQIYIICRTTIVHQTGIYLTAQSVVFVYTEQDLFLPTYSFSIYTVRNKTAITNKKNDKCLSKWETEAIDQTIYHTKTEGHLLGKVTISPQISRRG